MVGWGRYCPSNLKDIDGLESSEHSVYLESIEIDGFLYLLGVGTYTNETSWVSSVEITLFDIYDPTNLQKKTTYVQKNAFSNSG